MAKRTKIHNISEQNALIIGKVQEYVASLVEPPVFSLIGTINTAVLMNDHTYRTVPFSGGEEFIFKGLRPGKRAEYILEFEPIDAQPYKQMEISDQLSAEAMPEAEALLVKALGFGEEASWGAAKKAFIAAAEKEKQKIEQNARAESDAKYENNPLWGSF